MGNKFYPWKVQSQCFIKRAWLMLLLYCIFSDALADFSRQRPVFTHVSVSKDPELLLMGSTWSHTGTRTYKPYAKTKSRDGQLVDQ